MTAKSQKKRKQGRPIAAGTTSVGPEALIDAAIRLLQNLPPAQVTTTTIGREAGTDPALVRYYFGSRTGLLLAVVDRLVAGMPHKSPVSGDAVASLIEHMHGAFRFTRAAKQMQRLMIDELTDPKHPEARARSKAINEGAVNFIAELMQQDGGKRLTAASPLFLHLALIALADFFMSARPLIEMLTPEDTDMTTLAADYEQFVIDLLMKSLEKH